MGEYLRVLAAIKSCPKTFQSDFARSHSGLIAEAASRGHLSCLTTEGTNGGAWEVTARGVKFLKANGGCI